ncbi:MAG: phage holin family protein [Muribaculaceae bacterium]|nr:phage holin family protein [Muribaculaceae bacterium]
MPIKARQTIRDSINGISDDARRLAMLYIDKAKLVTTEKLSLTLSSIAFSAVAIAVGIVFLVFVSIGIGHLLASSIAPHLAYLIVAGFYLVLFIAVFCLRKRLFINPVTRFMSRMILNEPDSVDDDQLDELARQIAQVIRQTKSTKAIRGDIEKDNIPGIEDLDQEGGES